MSGRWTSGMADPSCTHVDQTVPLVHRFLAEQ